MDFDRRSFVKFAVGAVVGLHASPLVFKLMDDTAIWTQNWNWVPQPERGEFAFADSVNPNTGSGVRLGVIKGRMQGERFIRVAGNPDHPGNKGGITPFDVSTLQMSYTERNRVATPLAHDRVTGAYTRISWDKALNIIAEKVAELTKAGQAKTIAAICEDTGCTAPDMLGRLMAAIGSPNTYYRPGPETTLALAGKLMFGNSEIGFDLANTDYVLSFGAPLLERWGAPAATKAWFGGFKGKIAQVECRCSVTASQAETWVGVAPGGEAAVALAVAGLLIKNGTYDKAMDSAPGFAEFKKLVAAYTPEAVAKAHGANASKIGAVAKAFAASPKAVAVCGGADGGDPGSLAEVAAVMALNALKGNLGKPGGLVARKPLPLKPLAGAAAKPADAPLAPAFNPAALAEAGLKGAPYKVNMLITAGGNPAYAAPQAETMKKFMAKVPFIVAITPYRDETSAMADLVLPQATFLEGWGDCANPYGSAQGVYGIHQPLMKVHPEVLGLGDILIKIAAKLGGKAASAVGGKSMEEVLKARTAAMGGFDKLVKKSFWVEPKPAYAPFKAKFLAKAPAKVKTYKAYPLVMAPIVSARTKPGGEPVTPYAVKILDNTTLADRNMLVVEINPATAKKLNIKEGEVVTLRTPAGAAKVKAHLFPGAAPDTVFVPLGLGHTAFSDYLKGKGVNFHALAEVSLDADTKMPRWALTRAALGRARG